MGQVISCRMEHHDENVHRKRNSGSSKRSSNNDPSRNNVDDDENEFLQLAERQQRLNGPDAEAMREKRRSTLLDRTVRKENPIAIPTNNRGEPSDAIFDIVLEDTSNYNSTNQQQQQQQSTTGEENSANDQSPSSSPNNTLSPNAAFSPNKPYKNSNNKKKGVGAKAILNRIRNNSLLSSSPPSSPNSGSSPHMDSSIPVFKLLLLGTGETGKTTICKQLRLKLDPKGGLDDEELKQHKVFIICNMVNALGKACEHMNEEGITYESEDAADIADSIVSLSERQSYLVVNAVSDYDEYLYDNICELWSDKSVQRTMRERMSDFDVCDSVLYFLDNLGDLSPPFDTPTVRQVLATCRKTTGIVQTYVSFRDVRLHLVDVGGQRNERKKWSFAYHDVNMVLFVVALSDYYQQLYEDDTVNRMKESLDVFANAVNDPALKHCPFFLIFNKVDSFEYRMRDMMQSLQLCFPEFEGGYDTDAAKNFIEDQFTSLYRKDETSSRKLHIEYVTATDIDNMGLFIERMREVIEEGVPDF